MRVLAGSQPDPASDPKADANLRPFAIDPLPVPNLVLRPKGCAIASSSESLTTPADGRSTSSPKGSGCFDE
jgi:hypothetical protein